MVTVELNVVQNVQFTTDLIFQVSVFMKAKLMLSLQVVSIDVTSIHLVNLINIHDQQTDVQAAAGLKLALLFSCDYVSPRALKPW